MHSRLKAAPTGYTIHEFYSRICVIRIKNTQSFLMLLSSIADRFIWVIMNILK